jgi:RHS repeat-associated protein
VKARKLQREDVTPAGQVAPVSRFTGKEEDVEVGLQYFGKRYLSPYLGRWISPDPLAVHAPGKADLNLYAYVRGRTLQSTDPFGLVDDFGHQNAPQPPQVTKTAEGAAPAPEKPPTTALQLTSYPDKLRAAVGEASAKCGDGVCKFAGFIATMATTALTFPGDVANTLNTGLRSAESFKNGHPVRGALEGLQVAGNVLFASEVVGSSAEALEAGSSSAGGNGRGFSYTRTANPKMLAQTTENGCGGACATQWLADQGIQRHLKLPEPSMGHEIAREMGSEYIGGSFTKPEAVLESGKTFMAHVSNVQNQNGHWLLIDKIENGTVMGRDPWGLAGLASDSGTSVEMSLHYFREIWAKGGYAGVFKVR